MYETKINITLKFNYLPDTGATPKDESIASSSFR